MSPDRNALVALTGFELRRGLSRPGARSGFMLFLVALAIGAWDQWVKGGEPGTMFGEGFLIWTMGLVTYGLAADRRQAFDSYLIRNHTSPRAYLAAKALSMVALVLGAGAIALLLRTLSTGGDLAGSLWSATTMTLVALMVAPLALVVEGQVDTSMPAAFVILGYAVVGGLLFMVRQSLFLFELPGIAQLEPGSWASMAPLAARAAIGIVPAFLIAGALVELNLRRY